MLNRGQEKLLRYLGTFPDALAEAWDVPRDLSLPGLSDAMNVVRSGLNQPLNKLLDLGYISRRVAHVLGGGSRRRQVYHITQQGRDWLAEHPQVEPSATASASATETSVAIVGRASEIKQLESLVEEHGRAAVGGLSGVGKTTLIHAVVAANKRSSCWSTVDELSDAGSVLAAWFSDIEPRPNDPEAMVAFVNAQPSSLLVIDDLHAVHARHRDGVIALLNGLEKSRHTAIVGGRLPLPEGLDWPVMQLETLKPEDAKQLLGEHLDEARRLQVAKALDGHPMALNLYVDGDDLPEAGENIQAFVEQTMLSNLTGQALDALDSMVLFPRPLPSEVVPGAEHLGEMDDRALLRWTDDGKGLEIQHLIRNVRRTMLTDDRLTVLHKEAVDHWASHIDDPAYAVLHLYHRTALGLQSATEDLEERFEELAMHQSGALAVIFERATRQRPQDEDLHYWAGRIALHRQETSQAREHICAMTAGERQRELAYGLAMLEGDVAQAAELLERHLEQAQGVDAARWVLKAVIQRLEDRVFDGVSEASVNEVRRLLNRITLPESATVRASVTVSISLVQLAIALLESDEEKAQSLCESLESISHENDPLVLQSRFKVMLKFNNGSPQDQKAAYEDTLASQTTAFHRGVVGLTYAEHLALQKGPSAKSVFDSVPVPDALFISGAPQWRYAARWWYLKGHLDPSSSTASLREAARCFRQAGCTSAAASATALLHRLL